METMDTFIRISTISTRTTRFTQNTNTNKEFELNEPGHLPGGNIPRIDPHEGHFAGNHPFLLKAISSPNITLSPLHSLQDDLDSIDMISLMKCCRHLYYHEYVHI